MNKYYNKEKAKQYYQTNKEKLKAKQRKFAENNYEYKLFIAAKCRAKRDQIPFSLQKEDIIIPNLCPYLKIPLTRIQGQGTVWSNASLDRIDNTQGYSKNNIQVISWKANSMKQNANKEELITFAHSILEFHRNEMETDEE